MTNLNDRSIELPLSSPLPFIHSVLNPAPMQPVMCTTVERVETDDCDWYSCGEWCLSKSREERICIFNEDVSWNRA